MPFLPLDTTTLYVLFICDISGFVIFFVMLFVFTRSKGNLGKIFAWVPLVFNLTPSNVYDAINMMHSKETLDSKDYDEVLLARNNSTFKSKTRGPVLATACADADVTLDPTIVCYIQLMRDGKSPDKVRFDSRDEAYFSYYENIFLPSYKGATKEWIGEETERVKAAKGILARKIPKLTRDITESVVEGGRDAQSQTTETELVLKPVDEVEYDDLIDDIEDRLCEDPREIYPIQVGEERVTLNMVARWESSPISALITVQQFQRGRDLVRKKKRKQAFQFLLLAIALAVVMMAGSFAYKILTKP